MAWGALRVFVACASCLAVAACGRIGYVHEDGAVVDAAADSAVGPTDSAPRDSAPRDGAPTDSGLPDAAMPDGSPSDTGAADTGVVDAGTCSEVPCRLVSPQCGCATGQMCARLTPGSPMRSCTVEGANPAGERCTFSTNCQAGNTCVIANGAGICTGWCEGASDCGGTDCLRLVVADPVGACRVPCNAVANTGCPAGLACYAALGNDTGGGTVTITACVNAGVSDLGTPCTSPFGCGPGLGCPVSTCVELCDLDAPACAAGTCTDLGWSADGVRYGECR